MRRLGNAVAHQRSGSDDLILGLILAFVAGAINAGGFLAVGQYTSHMTGIVSSLADNAVLGLFPLAALGLAALLAFVAGAMCSAILINWGRRHIVTRQYAYPIALEALLLLLFGLLGSTSMDHALFEAMAAPLLCFIMGLQNATITKISNARIRTTHLTGMITDIGIECGKLVYWTGKQQGMDVAPVQADVVQADVAKLKMLVWLVGLFLIGGITGAVGFGRLGYIFSIPLALALFGLACPSLPGRSQQREKRPERVGRTGGRNLPSGSV